MKKQILTAAAVLFAVAAFAQAPRQTSAAAPRDKRNDMKDMRHDIRDKRHDQRLRHYELKHHDYAEAKKETKDIRADNKDIHGDTKDLKRDGVKHPVKRADRQINRRNHDRK